MISNFDKLNHKYFMQEALKDAIEAGINLVISLKRSIVFTNVSASIVYIDFIQYIK